MTWLRHQVIPDVVLPYCVTESSLKKALATVLDVMAKKTVQKNDAQEKTTCVKY
jgi:ribosome biogenesis SPOUT family RNA methylase Rps3